MRNSERGAVFVVFIGVLSVVALIAAIAIDLGNLYRAQLALQKSADATALAGIAYTNQKGKFGVEKEVRDYYGITNWANSTQRDAKMSDYLVLKTQQVGWATMRLNGLPHVPSSAYTVDLTGVYESVDPKVVVDIAASFTVVATRRVNFLLIDLLPAFIGDGFRDLTATARAERKVANVVVFADISDSMNCPATGNCDCWLKPNTGACTAPTKFDRLFEAITIFAEMFDPARDKIYVVPFNIRGRAFTLSDYGENIMGLGDLDMITPAQIQALVASIQLNNRPEGNTNICDAFMRGMDRLEADAIFGSKDVSYVLFTDGAPTAGRWLFADAKAALPAWNQGGGAGVYDYKAYTVDWQNPADPSEHYYGPSPLVQTDLLGMDFKGPVPPADGSGKTDEGAASAAITAACSIHTGSGGPLREVKNASMLNGVATSVFSPCLNTFAARSPQGGVIYGTEYSNGGTKEFVDWREMYFNCAVMIADDFRANRGRVYTIGIGEPAPLGANPNTADPYQSAADVSLRHDVFNTRLAADIYRATNSSGDMIHPDFKFSGAKTHNQVAATNGLPGIYLAAPDADQLDNLFKQIAHQILMRLSF